MVVGLTMQTRGLRTPSLTDKVPRVITEGVRLGFELEENLRGATKVERDRKRSLSLE